jgi:hypothetical protein
MLRLFSIAVVLIAVALIAAAWIGPAVAAAQEKLPDGSGLAAQYPGDKRIAADRRVLVHEDFESDDLAALARRWDSVSNQNHRVLAWSDDVPPGSAGRRSLAMTATLGENTGGHLYRRLPRPLEQAYFRFYVKFDEPGQYIHHFVTMGGYRPATAWPQGGAGSRPRGDERFTVGIEPTGQNGRFPAPGTWNFYTYWAEMKASAGGRYWGNSVTPPKPRPIPPATWQCVEVMVKLNQPDRRDGELALWIDGNLVMDVRPGVRRGNWTGMGFPLVDEGGEPFEGFRWRTTSELQINFFWLMHYVTENAARQNRVAQPGTTNRVWFDDLVIATEYIGPISRDRAP